MADFAYSQSEMETAEELDSGRFQALINFIGGLVSITLIAGMVAWGWQMLVRDVSGVPVVEALEGPMRVEPADPGGTQADHQGLAVNRIAEGQEAAPAADRIVLAPPPVELGEVAPAAAPAPLARSPLEEDIAAVAPLEPQAVAEDGAQQAAADAAAAPTPEAAAQATLALIDQLAAQQDTDAGLSARGDTIPISTAGVRSSRIPVARPAALELAAADLVDVTEAVAQGAPAQPTEIDVAGLASGTRLVQLGAFDAPEEARGEWDRLAAAFPDFFASRSRIVEEAVSGGRTFYRLRAHGFEGLMDARRFCTALLAEGAACIPVTVR